eukprot:6294921-Amphidinium_carterae.1
MQIGTQGILHACHPHVESQLRYIYGTNTLGRLHKQDLMYVLLKAKRTFGNAASASAERIIFSAL